MARALLILVLVIALPIAQAIPVTYDEAVSGDLDQSGTQYFAFDIGDNRIDGTSWTRKDSTGASSDFDYFSFGIPTGSRLISVTASVDDFVRVGDSSGGNVVYAALNLTLQDYPLLQTIDLSNFVLYNVPPGPTTPSPSAVFAGVLPIDGQFLFGLRPDMSGGCIGPCLSTGVSWSVAYRLDFEVAQVPEPATLALLSLYVIGLGFSRRRKQAIPHQHPTTTRAPRIFSRGMH